MMVLLKYLGNFWRSPEMPLVICGINLILTCSTNCLIIAGAIDGQVATLAITDTKLYVPVVTLSTQNNAKLSQQLK